MEGVECCEWKIEMDWMKKRLRQESFAVRGERERGQHSPQVIITPFWANLAAAVHSARNQLPAAAWIVSSTRFEKGAQSLHTYAWYVLHVRINPFYLNSPLAHNRTDLARVGHIKAAKLHMACSPLTDNDPTANTLHYSQLSNPFINSNKKLYESWI